MHFCIGGVAPILREGAQWKARSPASPGGRSPGEDL
jgi:hypothetical protein